MERLSDTTSLSFLTLRDRLRTRKIRLLTSQTLMKTSQDTSGSEIERTGRYSLLFPRTESHLRILSKMESILMILINNQSSSSWITSSTLIDDGLAGYRQRKTESFETLLVSTITISSPLKDLDFNSS